MAGVLVLLTNFASLLMPEPVAVHGRSHSDGASEPGIISVSIGSTAPCVVALSSSLEYDLLFRLLAVLEGNLDGRWLREPSLECSRRRVDIAPTLSLTVYSPSPFTLNFDPQ
jgi:hypothetical protein